MSYKIILEGKGFGLDETILSIVLAREIRNIHPIGVKGDYHPYAKLPLTSHPFSI